MAEDHSEELFRQLRVAQDKYTYFLLAAVASGVAFAVTRTESRVLSWSLIPLGLAILAWGFSFYFGCRKLSFVHATLYANLSLIAVMKGTHPEVGYHPQKQTAAAEGIRQAMESNSDRIGILGDRQFRLLVAGAVLYVMWHVTEMILRTARIA